MSLQSVLRRRRLIAPWLVDGRVPSSSCDRCVLGWYERPPRIRLDINLALDVSTVGPGLNRVSSPLDKSLPGWKACRRNPATGLAIDRFHQDRKPFPMEPAVEVQHASS